MEKVMVQEKTSTDRATSKKPVDSAIPKGFASRHIGPNAQEISEMLKVIGAGSVDELMSEVVPEQIRTKNPLGLPIAMNEYQYLNHARKLARKNKVFRTYIGMGYYNTLTPPVILRNVFENPGWYTQYTPYQAEMAQGRLESLLNFQTMVTDLTGMELANASLLDEATAAAEAMTMLFHAREGHEVENKKFFVSDKLFPQNIDVLKTRSKPLGIELVVADHAKFDFGAGFFGAILQYPDGDGRAEDITTWIEKAHAASMKVILISDLLALTLLKSPGELGAEVCVGSAQRFGVPLGYGGPHAAFFATKDKYKRQMPGRIIGVSVDAQGKKAYRMALQTREQHIRRENATSNICTAQALLANMAAMYAVYHGPSGLKEIATQVHHQTAWLAHELEQLGFKLSNESFFDTLKVGSSAKDFSEKIKAASEQREINFRYHKDGTVGISLDETTSEKDLKDIVAAFAEVAGKTVPSYKQTSNALWADAAVKIAPSLRRTSEYLTHPVFNTHHSETQMMRYMKSLENKDLALNTSMISLGSCTMKLNAASEMIPVSFAGFAYLHPFVPIEQGQGYQQVVRELEDMLCKITGFAACSLQPNSGAQGEYAGLLVIMAYHADHGQSHRNVALIPSSAHGTNPASAVLAGMKVVVVKSDDQGNIDVEDLKAKAEQHKDDLACLMVTYPSTHGIYEERIREVCDVIHKHGGLVYMDGANMNAQVGLTNPGAIGADVNHLNLHKTFAIPHGGGGPGMGPICVNEKLAPYLPSHPVIKCGGEKSIPAVSAAPWGSASILMISYGYLMMLGEEGSTLSTKIAILNANYIKSRLEKHFSILYEGKNKRCAHEMIVEMREFKKAGIEVEDIAKRLMDYGFHAPTVSFPVAGTMMIEPTESEDKAELDRFCDALISIRKEIDEVANGQADKTDNVLKNAPHPIHEVLRDDWKHSYSREKAAYPLPFLRENKFWVPISRINNTYGDRNLMCTCPPMESYES